MNSPKNCPTCSIVDIVCYWGEMPQAKWKRPFILIVCLLAEIGVAYWMFFSVDQGAETWVAKVLAGIIASFCGLGIVAAIWGCDKCVAQVCGKGQT